MLPSELLEQGWCQGDVWNDKGEHCLIGAAIKGQGDMGEFMDIVRELIRHRPDYAGHPANWNNDPNRTQAEVVALARLVEIRMGLRVEGEDWEIEPLEVGEIEMVERELVGGRS